MFDYSKILSEKYVKSNGVYFDETKFSFESYWENGINHYERLFYKQNDEQFQPFSGLEYELYPDGKLWGYSYYKDGYKHGEDVEFYPNGQISKYINFQSDINVTYIIRWHKNGQIKLICELSDHSRHKKFTEYDENGNVMKQGEK